MKIVINKCYGGFGLSNEAEELYAELSGFKLYRYKQTKHRYKDEEDLYVKTNSKKNDMFCHTYTVDHGRSFSEYPKKENAGYWHSGNIERDDAVLVQVVEQLGKKANSGFADLKVVEIPDDIQWEIDEYDGLESISEVHRSWG